MKVIIQCGNPDKLIWSSPTTFFFPERYLLHPKKHIEFVNNLLKDNHVNKVYHKDMFQDDKIYIITNSEHIINRFRIAKRTKSIEDLVIQFETFNNDKSAIYINIDSKGECSEYPEGFMDEWSNQLLKLM